jgi:hypothetical protein
VIYDREVLRTVIIPLLNGNLRTVKKLERFNKWCSDHFDIAPSTHTPLTAAAGPAAGWLSGFTDGDGSFFPLISKNTGYRIGYQVKAVFDIAQVDSERAILNTISQVFFANSHHWAKSGKTEHMRITNFKALLASVEPFFIAHPLQSRKLIDFLLWQEMLRIIERRDHLTLQGLERIRELRALQHFNRNFVHASTVAKIIALRPDYKGFLE